MHHHNIMRRRHIGARALLTRFMIKHASPSHVFDVRLNRSSFPCSRCRTQYFPQLEQKKKKSTKSQSRKRGALCVPWVLNPLLDGPMAWPTRSEIHRAHDEKRPKPTFRIKTGRHYLDRKPRCPYVKVEVSS